MGKNLNQVPTQATSILASDKMYIARSPFGVTDDRYILGSDIMAQLASPLTTKGDLYTFTTVDARLAVAVGDGKILQVASGAATGLAWSTPTYPSASGSIGKILISDGTNNIYSTPTYPNAAGAAGSIIISDGTNKINSTSLWPNTVGTNLHILLSNGISNIYSTPAYPNASVTAGKLIISDGTDYIASTSIWPNTVGSAGKIIRSDGTINTYTTSTFADTYLINTIPFAASANTIAGATLTSIIDAAIGSTQGNILYRNSTVWTVLAPGTAGQFLQSGGAAANVAWASEAGTGTVTSFSAGTLSPIFTTSVANPTTTPALSFILTNAAANTYLGNATGISAAPSYSAAGALTKTNDTNVTLTLGGAPTTSLLTATSLTLGWTGVLSLARGGTNADTSAQASNGGIVWSNATQMQILGGTATARQMLQSGSTATPAWSTTTWPATSTAGRILYSTFTNVIGELSTTNSSVLGSTSAGVPNWLALTDGQLVIGSTAGQPAAASLSAGTGITITPGSNSISIAVSSGAGSPLTTKGDLYTFSTVNARLAVGSSDGQLLQVSSGAATGLAWSTTTYPTTNAINTMMYASSANVLGVISAANNGVLVTSNTGVPSWNTSLGQGLSVASSVLSVGGANNIAFNNAKGLQDNNGINLINFSVAASAVNFLQIGNNATGLPPVINAAGTDTNIDFNIGGKGTGAVNILGASTNSSATAGYVGELLSAAVLFASAVSFTNGVVRNITSVSLTAGDWDVWGNIFVSYTVTSTGTAGAISTTSATLPDTSLLSGPYAFAAATIANVGYTVLQVRLSLSTTTTVYLAAFSNFTAGASTGSGAIYARRRR